MALKTIENMIEDNEKQFKLLISADSGGIGLKDIEMNLKQEDFNNVSPMIVETIRNQSVKIHYRKHCKMNMELPLSESQILCDEYTLSYDELLKYQRMINLGLVDEHQLANGSYYYHRIYSDDNEVGNQTGSVINKELLDVLVRLQTGEGEKTSEWDIIPDIYILYPVKYPVGYKTETKSNFEYLKEHLNKAKDNCSSKIINTLIESLEKRKVVETNIPAININYLGKALCHIKSNENNDTNACNKSLGNPVWVDFVFVWDQKSSSGVVILCSLSTPFLMSYLLDAISNNDLIIQDDEKKDDDIDKYENVEKYLDTKFKISIHGTAKSFVIIPNGKECLTLNQRAALLSSEAIFPDDCGYGHIIDEDIMAAAQNNIGQYDRADVYAYSTVLLVFNKDLQGSIQERIETESITLFYIILILMEEASICIANDEVVELLADVKANDKNNVNNKDESIAFLEKTNAILSEYAKTIDFWKAQLRYPTSQRSLDNIRKALKVDEKLSVFKRNQQQLDTLFNVKSEIRDRMSESQTNEILIWLSIIAIFSVLNDSMELVSKLSKLLCLGMEEIVIQLIIIVVIVSMTIRLYWKYYNRFKI